ncbi:MAG: DoxX family membrane protein [Acidobacteria bacterium]|nr:DoxX family membrane protein [Acidobacteriota bacterium]
MSSTTEYAYHVLALFATTSIALIFIASGGMKLLRPKQFVGIVRDFQILPDVLTKPVAYLLPYLELCVALFLLLNVYRDVFLVVAVIMLAAFTFAITINLMRGRVSISCGCFGSRKQELTWLLVVRNLLLIVVAMIGSINTGHLTHVALAESLAVILSIGVLVTLYHLSAVIVRFWRLPS